MSTGRRVIPPPSVAQALDHLRVDTEPMPVVVTGPSPEPEAPAAVNAQEDSVVVEPERHEELTAADLSSALLPDEGLDPLLETEPNVAPLGTSVEQLAGYVESVVTGVETASTYVADAEVKARALLAAAVSDAQRIRDRAEQDAYAMRMRAETDAREVAAKAQAEADRVLGARLERIAKLTEALAEIADIAAGRLADGELSNEDLLRFIVALTEATERAVGRGDETPGGSP